MGAQWHLDFKVVLLLASHLSAVFPSHVSASLSSNSSDSFIIMLHLPHFSDALIPALVALGASLNFIDTSFLEWLQVVPIPLSNPVELSHFDCIPTAHGLINHSIHSDIMFSPGYEQSVNFLVTTLHPSASIILRLSWLCYTNPDIDWHDLQLQF